MSDTKYAVGQVVGVAGKDRHGRWEIKEIKGDRVLVLPLEGQQDGTKFRGVRTQTYMLTDAPAPAHDSPYCTPHGLIGDEHADCPHSKVFSVAIREPFRMGEIVTCVIAELAGVPLVVLVDKGHSTGKVNVAKLFGDGDMYYRPIPETLRRLSKSELARMLLDTMSESEVDALFAPKDEQS